MLQHLATFEPDIADVYADAHAGEFTPLEKADPVALITAQDTTANWLAEMGVPLDEDETRAELQRQFAREAFVAVTGGHHPLPAQRVAVAALKSPAAVRHLTGMLSAYDWEYVDQAKEIRGYAVAQIIQETKHPDAKIRLKALEMLGKVTEISLFTEKIELSKGKDVSDEDLDKRIRERISSLKKVEALIAPTEEIQDVTAKETPNA